MQHIDLFTRLRGDILVKADKMTMANSLDGTKNEPRHPHSLVVGERATHKHQIN